MRRDLISDASFGGFLRFGKRFFTRYVGPRWFTKSMATSTFTWPNREMTLVASGETHYVWTENPSSPPAGRVVGQWGSGEPTGVVACGDALDVLESLALDGRLTKESIKALYIDPPFGTGKRFGHYNDALAEAAWLSMMKDRLEAVLPYMSPDGSIWVHLDETMSHKARLILDDILGDGSYVATIIWQKRLTVESRTAISSGHDPILVYAMRGPKHWKTVRNRISGEVCASNRDGDPRGPWKDAPFTAPGYRPAQQYVIVNPAGIELTPSRGRSWFGTEPLFKKLVAENRIWWTKDGAGQPRIKNFGADTFQVPGTIWTGREVGTNDDAKRHLAAMFPEEEILFDTPKPESLLRRIVEVSTEPGDLVVDLFAGSGSTAATAHKLGRRWIAAERIPATVASVLVPRAKAVVEGADPAGITPEVGWTGGGSFELLIVPPRLDAETYARQLDGVLSVTH